MSDFKFTDEDAPSLPPPTPPVPPQKASGAEKSADPAPQPSGFSFTDTAPPKPQKPTGAAPPVTPAAPAAANTPPQRPAQPGQPTGTPPQNRPPGAGQSQAQSQAPGQPQTPPPARPLQPRPHPANRPSPAPIPGPSITIPVDHPTAPAASSEREGAPQDNFSFKIWSIGQSIGKVLDAFEPFAVWLLRVSAVIGITALAYVLAGIFFGNAGNLQANPHAATLVKNMTMASQALMLSLIGIGVSSILLGYEDNRIGIVVAAVGVLCNFVVPVLLKKSVGENAATFAMAPFFRRYGYYLVIIGMVKGVCDVAVWLFSLPEKIKEKNASVGVASQAEPKQRIIAREANMASPCWRLPFCRESIRKQCPAFLAKKTCWKFGRGCYCDEEMISRIVRGEAQESVAAPTRQSRQGKAPCGRCYIYLEHQTYKFRVFSPLALPASVLATWLAWPAYVKIFAVGNNAFDAIFNTLSFNSTRLTPEALETSKDSLKEIAQLGNRPEDVAVIAQNMIGVLLGFMLLIYISKFIEWAIFKAKW